MPLADHIDTTAAIAPAHHPWVCQTFARSAHEVDGGSEERKRDVRILLRVLRDPRARSTVAVPHGFPDDFLGWSLALDGALVFAYVGYRHRRQGLGSYLMGKVTPDAGKPWRLAYWTRAASRMALKGFPVTHDLDAYEALLQLDH